MFSRTTLSIAVLTTVSVVAGCGSQGGRPEGRRPEYWRAKLESIETRDAVAEARANFAKGDFRFMAVYADTLDVPVVEGRADALELIKKYGTNPVPETSDALEGESHRRYHLAARKLCAKYNQEMLRLLDSQAAP